jgi:COMPASS component SWD1
MLQLSRRYAAVLSVSWSRDGRKIISAAADFSMSVWSVEEDDEDADPQLGKYNFPAPLHHVQFCPTNSSIALVSQVQAGPITFALNRSRKVRLAQVREFS